MVNSTIRHLGEECCPKSKKSKSPAKIASAVRIIREYPVRYSVQAAAGTAPFRHRLPSDSPGPNKITLAVVAAFTSNIEETARLAYNPCLRLAWKAKTRFATWRLALEMQLTPHAADSRREAVAHGGVGDRANGGTARKTHKSQYLTPGAKAEICKNLLEVSLLERERRDAERSNITGWCQRRHPWEAHPVIQTRGSRPGDPLIQTYTIKIHELPAFMLCLGLTSSYPNQPLNEGPSYFHFLQGFTLQKNTLATLNSRLCQLHTQVES